MIFEMCLTCGGDKMECGGCDIFNTKQLLPDFISEIKHWYNSLPTMDNDIPFTDYVIEQIIRKSVAYAKNS